MRKIGLLGLEPEEKKYFTDRLPANEYELLFYDDPVDIHKLDSEIEVLSVFVDFIVTRDVLELLPNLKLIACRSTGYNNIDMDAASERGIKVANTPGYGSSSVAEYTFALILMLSRKMPMILHETTDASPDRKLERGFDLYGKTIGIIGLGSIGKGVAQIAYGFGMRILAFDRNVDERLAEWLKIEYTQDLDQLYTESDVVTLHIPYTHENQHFVNAHRLDQMKETALLINTARGELVDTVTLVKKLKENKIAGAALDVVEEEYLLDPDELIKLVAEQADTEACFSLRHAVALSALQRMSNVIVTNHNAFNTNEAVERINSMSVENITGFYSDGKVYYI